MNTTKKVSHLTCNQCGRIVFIRTEEGDELEIRADSGCFKFRLNYKQAIEILNLSCVCEKVSDA